MNKLLQACGVSPKLMFRKGAKRGLSHMMPKMKKHNLKSLMVGKGVGQRRLSDAEIAHNVAMTGGATKRKHAPLRFKM